MSLAERPSGAVDYRVARDNGAELRIGAATNFTGDGEAAMTFAA